MGKAMASQSSYGTISKYWFLLMLSNWKNVSNNFSFVKPLRSDYEE